MRNVRLVVVMLRYRVASLLLPFFLLAPALHGDLRAFRWSYLAGLVALLASYVVATCLNDIFDFEVDRINHPAAHDRPLVTGDATPKSLFAVAVTFAVLAVGAATTVGALAVGLIITSLLLNVAYSVPPIRLCKRPVPAPLVLGFAYVALPYGIGLASAGDSPGGLDARVVGCFMLLFVGRMLLKDFRDRRGDLAYGKRTFLLTYGKRRTLLAVLACLVAGNALLVTVLLPSLVLVLVTETYFGAIGFELFRLWRQDNPSSELIAIARGARMGNAVILTWLGYLLLQSAGAAAVELAVFLVTLGGLLWFAFLLPAPSAASAATTA